MTSSTGHGIKRFGGVVITKKTQILICNKIRYTRHIRGRPYAPTLIFLLRSLLLSRRVAYKTELLHLLNDVDENTITTIDIGGELNNYKTHTTRTHASSSSGTAAARVHNAAGNGQLARPTPASFGAGPSLLGGEGVRLFSALIADSGGSGDLLRLELIAH